MVGEARKNRFRDRFVCYENRVEDRFKDRFLYENRVEARFRDRF